MTDKEIIIDGVEVSGCGYLNSEWCYEIDASDCEGSLEDAVTPCEENPNCYYKQLQRKEEECEELNLRIGALKDECNNCEKLGAYQRVQVLATELQTLKAENEELKEKYKWYDHYKESALFNKDLCNKQSEQLNRHKQALERIEKIASTNTECPDLECMYKEGPCTFPKCKDEFTENGKTCIVRGREEILSIIKEISR